MSRRNSFIQEGETSRYVVIGETGSIFLMKENRYPEKGEVLELPKGRAESLLSANLIAPYMDAQEPIKE
jgi:hypothetical protein